MQQTEVKYLVTTTTFDLERGVIVAASRPPKPFSDIFRTQVIEVVRYSGEITAVAAAFSVLDESSRTRTVWYDADPHALNLDDTDPVVVTILEQYAPEVLAQP